MPEDLRIGGLDISDILGLGETGITYKARDKAGRDVALKVVRWEYDTSDEKLQAEYALLRLSELLHPNLTQVFDVGFTESSKLWYTRSFVSGERINEVLPKIDVLGAQMLVLQIIDALDYLHRNGFIHGHLRPENIMVTKGSVKGSSMWESTKPIESPFTIKLCDFGITIPRSELRGDNILPADVNERTDIVTLGRILYEIYAGKLEEGQKPLLATIRELVPEPLQQLLARMLGIAYDEAFRSFQQVALYISELAPKHIGATTTDKVQKNIVLTKDSERRSFLLDILKESQEKGKFVIIEGDEGSGKSVLVREFAIQAQFLGHQVSVSTCQSRYSPLEPFLRFVADLEEGLKKKSPGILKTYEPVLSRIKGCSNLPKDLIWESTGEIFEAFQSFLTETCQIVPLALVIEDLELASDHTLGLLCHLLSSISETRLMVVVTYAPTKVRGDNQALFDALTSTEGAHRMPLSPLDHAGALAFIRYMLSAPEFPETIATEYFESSGGNLMKLEEMVRLSLEDGCLSIGKDGRWAINERRFLEQKRLGDLRLVVSKSIEGLTEGEQNLLRIIAVLGGRCTLSDILTCVSKTNLIKATEPKLLSRLVWGLITKGLLRRRSEAGGSFFMLPHGVYSEVLLQSVVATSRKDVYDNVFSAMSSEMSLPCDAEREAKLAQIALKGNDPISAFKSVSAAISPCIRQMAFCEAKFYLTKVYQMAPENEKTFSADCAEKMAMCDLFSGRGLEAFDSLQRADHKIDRVAAMLALSSYMSNPTKAGPYLDGAVNLIDELSDSSLMRKLLKSYLGFLQDTDPALALSFATNRASSTDDPYVKIECLLAASKLHSAMADFDIADKVAHQAMAIAQDKDLTSHAAKITLWQIQLCQMKGDTDKAARLIRRSSALIKSSWDLQTKTNYFKIAAHFHKAEREPEAALAYLQLWVTAVSKLRNNRELAVALLELGSAFDSKGLAKEAQHAIERSRRLAEDSGDTQTVGRALTFIGEYYQNMGLADQALVSFERAEKILFELADSQYLAKVYESLGRIWLAQNDNEKARRYLRLLKELVDQTGDQVQEGIYLKLAGANAASQEKWEKAEEYYIKALDIFDRRKMTKDANHLKIELSDLFVKQGEYFRALSKLSEARLFFEEENSSKELKRIRNTELSIDKELGKYGEDYRNLRMLLEISKALAGVGNIEELLPMVVDMALKVSGAERGFIMLLTPSGKLDFVVGRNQKKEFLSRDMFEFSTSVTDTALTDRKLVCITDTATDEKYRSRDSIVGLSLRSVMCGPLRVGDQVLGVIYVDSQVPTFYFSRKNAEFFEALCSHAATALKQARHHNQELESMRLQQENRMLKELTRQRVDALAGLKQRMEVPLKELEESLITIEKMSLSNTDLAALARSTRSYIISVKEMVESAIKSQEEKK